MTGIQLLLITSFCICSHLLFCAVKKPHSWCCYYLDLVGIALLFVLFPEWTSYCTNPFGSGQRAIFVFLHLHCCLLVCNIKAIHENQAARNKPTTELLRRDALKCRRPWRRSNLKELLWELLNCVCHQFVILYPTSPVGILSMVRFVDHSHTFGIVTVNIICIINTNTKYSLIWGLTTTLITFLNVTPFYSIINSFFSNRNIIIKTVTGTLIPPTFTLTEAVSSHSCPTSK